MNLLKNLLLNNEKNGYGDTVVMSMEVFENL